MTLGRGLPHGRGPLGTAELRAELRQEPGNGLHTVLLRQFPKDAETPGDLRVEPLVSEACTFLSVPILLSHRGQTYLLSTAAAPEDEPLLF